jgi:deferrochelatase/peroxidase EfeB
VQAKGILPRADDHVIRNPAAIGYIIGVTLRPDISRDDVQRWLGIAKALVDELVKPTEEGEDLADVAAGLTPSFFGSSEAPRFVPIQVPAGFSALPPVPGEPLKADLIFYVMSISEARVAAFLTALWATGPDVAAVGTERGYQRLDGTESFGYRDGLRNVRSDRRSVVAFVHRDELPEEPDGAEGGSYLVYMKIAQHSDAFNALTQADQDALMGRRRDGTRTDAAGVDPRAETDMPASEPPAVVSHVRKVGPRGPRDDTQIFRRGLPFVECRADGQVAVGLQFVSFQGSLDQFDVIFNDWLMNPLFPQVGFGVARTGVDALLDPGAGLTTIERSAIAFCPPDDERFIGATLFDDVPTHHKPKQGRVAVRKRVIDPSDPGRRFERGGFGFQLLDESGQPVGDTFVTDSMGHAQSDDVPTGHIYTLHELPTDRAGITPAPDQPVTLDHRRVVVKVMNEVNQAPGYGTR